MARLKDGKSVMFLISAGRAFHSRGPATEKALSPNFVTGVMRDWKFTPLPQSPYLLDKRVQMCKSREEVGKLFLSNK